MWSLMFIHFRIRNPRLSSKQVVQLMSRDADALSRLVRQYAVYAYETMQELSANNNFGVMLKRDASGQLLFKPSVANARGEQVELTREMVRVALQPARTQAQTDRARGRVDSPLAGPSSARR